MKTHKATGLILFLGILLVLSGIIIGKAVNIKVSEMNGYFGMGKIVLTQKNVAINNSSLIVADKNKSNLITADKNNSNLITVRDIERIKKSMEVAEVSYSSNLKTSVRGNNRNVEAEITGTTSAYPKFSFINLAAGSFFTEENEKESSRVAVIDEKLALKLFNSLEVVGNKITISGQSFSIIGVISTDYSMIQSLIEDDIPSIYIPSSTFFELNNTAAITHLEIKNQYNDTLGNNSKLVVKALEAIGKNPANYNIVDFYIEQALIKQKPDILIFLVGIISILILVLYIKRQFTSMISLIVGEAKSDYISSVVRARIYEVILLVVKTAGVAVFAIIIWKLIKFNLYIPPEYIPTDLTDMGYFKDLIHKMITTSNSDLSYVASKSEQILEIGQKVINMSFVISLLSGFIIFYIGLYQARALKIDSLKLLIQSGISLLISTILLTGLTFYFNMNIYIGLTTFVVLWIFICLNTIRFGSISERDDMTS